MPCARVLERHPVVRAVADLPDLLHEDVDVFSPNALGGALDDHTVEALRARVVCGGANNQLVTEGRGGSAERMRARGITYAPDFLVNAGGVIQVSDELHGFDMERARARTATIFDHTLEVLTAADDAGRHPRGGRRPARGAPDRRRWTAPLAARATPSGCAAELTSRGTGRAGSPLSGTTSPEPLHSCTVGVTTHTRFPGPLRDVG